MKKFTALLLALVMVLSLTACGAPTSGGDAGGEGTTGVEVEENVVPEEPSTPEATFAEVANGGFVVMDDDQCKITITGIEEGYKAWDHASDSIEEFADGFSVFVSVENKSADKAIGFNCVASAVNGLSGLEEYLFDETLSLDEFYYEYAQTQGIEPTKTADFVINIASGKEMQDTSTIIPGVNTEDVSVISAVFQLSEKDEDGWFWPVEEYTATLYRDSKDNAVRYERTLKDNDILLYEDDFVRVTAVSDYEAEYEETLLLFIENKTDSTVSGTISDQLFNDGEFFPPEGMTSFYSMTANSCAYFEIPALKENSCYPGALALVDFNDIDTWEFAFSCGYSSDVVITVTGVDLQSLYGA